MTDKAKEKPAKKESTDWYGTTKKEAEQQVKGDDANGGRRKSWG